VTDRNILIDLAAHVRHLRLRLPQAGVRLQNVSVNLAPLEDWNVQRAEEMVRREQAPRMRAYGAIIQCQINSGEIPRERGAGLQLRRNHPIVRRFVIGAQRIRALQTGFKIGDGKSLVGGSVGQCEFLSRR